MITRRGVLGGLLGALAAPAIIRTPGLLMPVTSHRFDLMAAYDAAVALESERIHDAIARNLYEGYANPDDPGRVDQWTRMHRILMDGMKDVHGIYPSFDPFAA